MAVTVKTEVEVRLVNLTKQDVVLIDETTGRSVTVPSSGVARVSSRNRAVEVLNVNGVEIPVLYVEYRDVVGLPAPEPETIYIVSGLVASVAGRKDAVAPARVLRTGSAIVGARALLRYPLETE